ncbi:S-layer homology domain-containing protein [Aneurinibacillus thermoaerophilus]|uniref:S-layer homology domain-containing protein n=1 Tax=Aneurinibacillus thermoaerophilus TaxID=143495 RepID=UPI002E22361B|nr:S-layer homology domain-containing protein [Aneurinibacillus thermoaerophilus]
MINKKMVGIFAATTLVFNVMSAEAAVPIFKDVKNHWGRSAVEWGVGNGMVNGYPDGTFKPDKTVTEAEFLTLLIRAYQQVPKGDGGEWSDPYYSIAEQMNYPTNGAVEKGKRNGIITRQHVAEILAGTQGFNYSGDDAIKFVLAKGLAKGTDASKISVESFNGSSGLKRAEAVQFIKTLKEKGLQQLQARPFEPSPVTEDMKKIPDKSPAKLQQPQNPPKQSGGVTVVPPKNENLLLPKDSTTEPAVQAFLDSLSYANGKVTGKIPEIPAGYGMTLKYKDRSDGKWGDRKYDKDFSSLKSGEQFSAQIVGKGGSLIFAIYKGNIGKNGVFVELPSMTAEWGSKR